MLAEWDIESAVQSESNAFTPASMYLLHWTSVKYIFSMFGYSFSSQIILLMKFLTCLPRIPGSLFAEGSSFGYHCGFSGEAINKYQEALQCTSTINQHAAISFHKRLSSGKLFYCALRSFRSRTQSAAI